MASAAVVARPSATSGARAVQAAGLAPATAGASQAPTTPVPTTEPPVAGPVALPLSGCPPPPRPTPGGPGPGAWHPDVLVPDARLPEPVAAPAVPGADPVAIAGKGMWLWQFGRSEGGNAAAVVARASAAGLRQLWVRVGDSRDGFYGAAVLADLVPKAHAKGLAVIGWGFPYLWDPVGDAAWSAQALAWRGPGGVSLDGFSPDIEMATEGVQLSDLRARVYLGLVRQAADHGVQATQADHGVQATQADHGVQATQAGRTLVVATVYRPTDRLWSVYPYAAIAPYVDAFAPMVYWGCTEPGEAAAQAMERLSTLKPVHVIGQAYDMADDGAGRAGPPSAVETTRFLDVARRGGAVGASFWVWQSIGDEQWAALSAYPWSPPAPPRRGTGVR